VGFVFQGFHLLPGLTAVENVELPLLPYARRRTTRRRALALLERVGLADRAGALPGQLSGGQQQRVAIARALVGDPVLLLADEPTGNLDSATAASVMGLLAEVRTAAGATMLVATHDPEVAARCDRVVHLRDGRVEDERSQV
jgi:putative ABC transport system ATP-binding protein